MASERTLESLLAWAHKTRAWTLKVPKHLPWGSLGFGPKSSHSCSTWDPSKHYGSAVRLIKQDMNVELLSWKLNCEVDLSEQAWVTGSFLQALNLSSAKGFWVLGILHTCHTVATNLSFFHIWFSQVGHMQLPSGSIKVVVWSVKWKHLNKVFMDQPEIGTEKWRPHGNSE